MRDILRRLLPSSIANAKHPGALLRYGTAGGAARYAGKYDRSAARRWTSARETAILRGMLARFRPDASLLDAPCGAGRFLETIAPKARRRVVLADASQAMLDAAKAALEAEGSPPVALRLVDLTADAPAEHFDVVVCVRLLHHLADGPAFSAVLDHLAGSATLGIICTFASSSTWKGMWRRFRRRLANRAGEVLRSDRFVEAELAKRGWGVVLRRRVSGLFSTQTWLLLVPRPR